mgnify:FL=1
MKEFRKILAGLTPEEREAVLEYLRPSKVPFFRPPDPEPDFSEWKTSSLGEHLEEKE